MANDFDSNRDLAATYDWAAERCVEKFFHEGTQPPSRKGRRQTLNSCLVQPARGVDARFRNKSLSAVSRASSATRLEKKLDFSVPSGVRPLDFRDHIAVERNR